MLGSNDAHRSRPTKDMIADLTTIIDKIMANNTMVVLSTIPPLRGRMDVVKGYNQAIRKLARKKKLPLVDFYAEILRRRPGNTWDGTLISKDGVHPTAQGGGYKAAGNPYAEKGKPLSEVGLLLRGWLTIQKFKQIKELVIDPTVASAPVSRPVGK
jgi:lysophospholipase L1-like esterase